MMGGGFYIYATNVMMALPNPWLGEEHMCAHARTHARVPRHAGMRAACEGACRCTGSGSRRPVRM